MKKHTLAWQITILAAASTAGIIAATLAGSLILAGAIGAISLGLFSYFLVVEARADLDRYDTWLRTQIERCIESQKNYFQTHGYYATATDLEVEMRQGTPVRINLGGDRKTAKLTLGKRFVLLNDAGVVVERLPAAP